MVEYPDKIVMCTKCIGSQKMVVFKGNPYKFVCPVCSEQDCTDLKAALNHYLQGGDFKRYGKLQSLLIQIGVWGTVLDSGYYN